jgi:single-strand DNA-binding protein
MYDATGKLKVIFDTQTFPSGFTKREFVLTIGDENYPQDVKFELIKDKCTWLDNFQQDQEVTVSFDIRGNEYKDKYYVNLNCWKIVGAGQGAAPSQAAAPAAPATTAAPQAASSGEPSPDDLRSDDIPF